MKLFAEIFFFVCAYAMLHTYILYPATMLLFAWGKKNKNKELFTNEELPEITIICAAYNEEKVIEEKIRSTFKTNYPGQKITFLIGSDNCSDRTVEIIKKLQNEFTGLKLVEFTSRTGKIGIINALVAEVKTSIIVMTDANVYFNPATLFELVKHFKNNTTGMVCGNIIKKPLNSAAVTQSELSYMNFENKLKYAESINFGIVVGAEGGCYAVRKEILKEIPVRFIADDFFITCLVLQSKKNIVFEKEALANEELLADTSREFRRKARIATGNFQNLFYFSRIVLRLWTITSFCFISHKVFRWKTPFYFITCFIISILLFKVHLIFQITFFGQVALLVLPFLNALLTGIGIKIKPLISLSHFMMMNAALLIGFIRFCKGVKSSVWEPVKR
ncbi:MAG TPA: glycosyltransferase [Bacteroidia bacterium]|nr:glycosyltransferase [Bacteroidia bacterium]